MFRTAMAKDNMAVSGSMSLSPLYVLVTLRDPKTHQEREVCTLASFLTGAIIEEHRLGYDDAGERKAYDIAMSTPSRVFEFKSRKARENVAPIYTPQQLDEVRRLLRGRSRARLRREAPIDLFKEPNQQSYVVRIYRREIGKKFWSSDALMVAVAHALLERGILVGDAHFGGSIGNMYVYDGKKT
jgi:hypothetical protein